jgi:nucleoside-diphosphate-sugar epimerase
MTTIALTGSAGFIGGYIVEEALKRNYRVVGIDNLSKYGRISRSYESNPNYTFIEGDARDSSFLEKCFEGVEHVIAGAALIGGISYFHAYAYDLLASNERIMAATCDAAIKAHKRGKLQKVTFLSSSMVYESATSWPSKEGDELNSPPPKSSYGFQKLAVEYYARAAWDQYRLPYTILRPFNCVGIGEGRAVGEKEILSGNISLAMSHVVPDLIQKILRGQNPLHILGDGEQIRCYTYGGDLARGILDSIESNSTTNRDYNLSTSNTTTVIELAMKIWMKIHGNNDQLQFRFDPPFAYDVQKRIPDVNKAYNDFGFRATTTLDTMLDEVIPWVREAIASGHI